MVKTSLTDFEKEWRQLSYEVGEEGEWASLRQVQSAQNQERYGEEALESGSKHRISLGFQSNKAIPRIFFTGTGGVKSDLTTAEWQKRLCAVLVNGKDKLLFLLNCTLLEKSAAKKILKHQCFLCIGLTDMFML